MRHLAIHALGQIDGAHAAGPQQTLEAIGPAKHRLRREPSQRLPRHLRNVSLERNGGAGFELEQRNYFFPCFRIDTVFIEILVAAVRRQVRDGMEDLWQLLHGTPIRFHFSACTDATRAPA